MLTVTGVVEGFYGTPWSWTERIEVLQWCAARGLTDYMYAPKDDPKHRKDWREPYDVHELAGFRSLVEQAGVRIGFAISPGLAMDESSAADRAALAEKLGPLLDLGITHVGLFLDDLPPDPSRTAAQRGEAHADLTTWLRDHLGSAVLLSLVPTEYIGTRSSPYLDALARLVPDEVPIGWTGASVVNDEITSADARARIDALGGRLPLLWDNVPVNDGVMSDRLFMGPLRGRAPELRSLCSGYLANPMVQARASMLPLASIAAWSSGAHPADGWRVAADSLGWTTFAEACDGAVPQRLVRELIEEADGPGWVGPADALDAWLTAVVSCDAPGLETEAAPWVAQAHEEAVLARRAVALFRRTRPSFERVTDTEMRALAPDPDDVLARAFGVASGWPAVRRAVPCVFGPRLAVRPASRQSATGEWTWRADAIEEDTNATDDVVRLALDAAASFDPAATLAIYVDGTEVGRGREVRFDVRPGCVVLARHGEHLNRLRVPA